MKEVKFKSHEMQEAEDYFLNSNDGNLFIRAWFQLDQQTPLIEIKDLPRILKLENKLVFLHLNFHENKSNLQLSY